MSTLNGSNLLSGSSFLRTNMRAVNSDSLCLSRSTDLRHIASGALFDGVINLCPPNSPPRFCEVDSVSPFYLLLDARHLFIMFTKSYERLIKVSDL